MSKTAVRAFSFAAVTRHAEDLVSRREVLSDQPAVEMVTASIGGAENRLAMFRATAVDVIDSESADGSAAGAARRRGRAVVSEYFRAAGRAPLLLEPVLSLAVIFLISVLTVKFVHGFGISFPVLAVLLMAASLAPVKEPVRCFSVLAELREQSGNLAFSAGFTGGLGHAPNFTGRRKQT